MQAPSERTARSRRNGPAQSRAPSPDATGVANSRRSSGSLLPQRPLRPANIAEVADALAYALRYDGRQRVHHTDDAMARITASI